MKELEQAQFGIIQRFLNEIDFETAYPYSILESRQQGRIFVDKEENPTVVLFWHYFGFAHLIGDASNDHFNGDICRLLSGEFEDKQRRFILHIKNGEWNETIANLVKSKCNIGQSERYLFRFNHERYKTQRYHISDASTLREIDQNILPRLSGKNIPGYFWDTPEAFLHQGKGFCLLDQNDIVCAAFSSAIGNGQMDIGVETKEKYCGKGLGTFIAAKMVDYALKNGLEPAWGCYTKNIASAAIAGKCVFRPHPATDSGDIRAGNPVTFGQ